MPLIEKTIAKMPRLKFKGRNATFVVPLSSFVSFVVKILEFSQS